MEVISTLIYLYREGADGKKGSETGPQSVSEWEFGLELSLTFKWAFCLYHTASRSQFTNPSSLWGLSPGILAFYQAHEGHPTCRGLHSCAAEAFVAWGPAFWDPAPPGLNKDLLHGWPARTERLRALSPHSWLENPFTIYQSRPVYPVPIFHKLTSWFLQDLAHRASICGFSPGATDTE